MKKVKLKPVHQSFGCELDNFLIPVKQQRILSKLGIGTRILSVPRRKKVSLQVEHHRSVTIILRYLLKPLVVNI